MKRVFDVIISILLLIILLPLLLLIALAVKLEEPQLPIFVFNARAGKSGKVFRHWRFRTMAGQPLLKTRLGRFIGNLSLDDIPTLWNVIIGEMSLVGPRPEAIEKVNLNDPVWRKVLSVQPGLTGLGLLTYLEQYNSIPIKQRLTPELFYVVHHSFKFDLLLLGKTFLYWLKLGHLKGKF